MTIAFVFEIFIPIVNGIITSTQNLAENLIADGHRVIYIAPKWKHSTITEVEGVPVFYIESYEAYVYPGMRNVFPWNRQVQRIIKREGVDIVHATGPYLLNWAALRAARRLDKGTVQTFHTMLQEPSYIRYFAHTKVFVPLLRAIAWRYFGLYMRKSDAVTGPSRYVKEELSRHYPETAIFHIPNGVDIERFSGAAPFEATSRRFSMFNEKTFIFIGRLGAEKSVDILIDGFSIAIRRDPEIRLILVGDGPGKHIYKRQVRELGLRKSVFFLGRLSPDDLYSSGLIHNAVANVTASTTESFGMTVVEAMASGTPSIVPKVPGISEIAEGTGLTFPKDDTEGLAEQVLTMAKEKSLRDALSKACVSRSSFFDGRVVAERFEKLYRRVLDGRAAHLRQEELDYSETAERIAQE